MNRLPVNGLFLLPNGGRIYRCNDDATAKAHAIRLGLYQHIIKNLSKQTGHRGAAGIAYDGPQLMGIVVWEGFETAQQNGWASLTISPACEENRFWLDIVVRKLINATEPARLEEGNWSWPN